MKPITCEDFRSMLDMYLDGDLSKEKQQAFLQHAETCRACGEELSFAEEVLRSISTLDEGVVMPLECQAAWRSTIRREAAPVKKRRATFRTFQIAGTIAAALVLMLFGKMLSDSMNSGYRSQYSPPSGAQTYYDYDTAFGDYNIMDMAGSMVTEEAAPREAGSASAKMALFSDGGTENAVDVQETSRAKVIRNASRSIETMQFAQDLAAIEDLVAEYEGYFQSSNVYGKEPSRSASLTARIPAESLDAFLTSTGAIGTVRSASESAADITSSYIDTETRLATKKERLARLQELVAEARNLKDLLTLEDKQNELLYEIESLEAQIQSWDQRVSYSTVDISLEEVIDNTKVQPIDETLSTRIRAGFANSLNALSEMGQSFLVMLVAFVPQLIWIAPLGVIIALIVRRVKKRRMK